MNISIRMAIVTVFFGLCFAISVHATEPDPELESAGFRPSSDLWASFVKRSSTARIAVFPTIIRKSEHTSYSIESQQRTVEFLGNIDLGASKAFDLEFEMGEMQVRSQWEFFQTSMQTIGKQLGDFRKDMDYALVLEILFPPGRSPSMEVFGIHVFILEPDGSNAFSFLLNSHHGVFVDADLRTSDISGEGESQLVIKSTKVALLAFKEQFLQAKECIELTAASVSISDQAGILYDFESALTSGKDGNGIPVGFSTFNDPKSTASISTTAIHPPLPDEAEGNKVLQLDLNATEWAGFLITFENVSVDRWISRDWFNLDGFSFWLYGNNSGTSLFVDVLDNRKDCSAYDDAERYTYSFTDDFLGWKQVAVQFSDMVRKEIGNEAPNDGLNLYEVHGWALGAMNTSGQATYFIDDFELHGRK